jgi:hypothetical protein
MSNRSVVGSALLGKDYRQAMPLAAPPIEEVLAGGR